MTVSELKTISEIVEKIPIKRLIPQYTIMRYATYIGEVKINWIQNL